MATLWARSSDESAHCRCCGKKLPKWLNYIEFGPERRKGNYVEGDDPTDFPKSKDEAQRHTNQKIVQCKWSGPKHDRRIVRVSTWDEETYRNGYFCTIQCAVDFAWLMAESGHQTKAHAKATEYQNSESTSVIEKT